MNPGIFIVISLLVMAAPVQTFAQSPDDRALSKQGDAEAGRITFMKCQACHTLGQDGGATVGPNLANIFGRMAGTSDSYASYSKALRESGIVWSEQELDNWTRDPQNFLPGNKMPFAGIRSEQERKDLLAYLREATEN